ncbi:ABC transporter substrate-binding protein, partial [Saccharothrix sp. MB29]|nr:ABC transporter substrate-binding protein [Saccharothrix sp. MB29]
MALLAAVSLVATGCGSGGPADESGPVTLTVSVWNLQGTPEFKALFDAFERAHPEVTVEPVDILADDYAEKVTTMLAAGLGRRDGVHDRAPRVVVGAVDLARAVAPGQLPGQFGVLVPGQVLRVGHAGPVEEPLVVVEHPEVVAVGQGEELAVHGEGVEPGERGAALAARGVGEVRE